MKNLITCVILVVAWCGVGAQGINPLSLQSLYVEVYLDSMYLGSATGFVVSTKTADYLITNWHVVTNKSPYTKKWLVDTLPFTPNRIKIFHNDSIATGKHIEKYERLIDAKNRRYYAEFSRGKEMVDMIALPLTNIDGIVIYPVDYKKTYEPVSLQPTDRVFIVGYPYGFRSAKYLPIWKSGLIASEPSLDQEGRPLMYIDAMGYPGMSGSPVFMVTDTYTGVDGGKRVTAGTYVFFMGIYSAGKPYIGLGTLWKSVFLKDIFDKLP